ncbi:methyl-accepting chemotaxis sensory transducer with Pas/Pac sensor [Solidesulfovibrio carbinoliphilus subsp. oakridgensis]|uniref:Methyl-accepting chemotaxis sensory transducer with Pas/Pac sensor n=1 Tax=Solidesulfovibrio carbinoliphilus subsp. oakridgensis TaxID=694327 RepID=G7QBX8_9BACT|nr:methyl-accepting chemotaxis protein [Solidesulfovibrio carbinoliphilus]EHJ49471.1 methyl-accepting chemotaxis sensory transducer with Pas/Pac sensor [Solidesulfovibrio carbinoliphilus subsp. oakridgensis]
MPKASSNTLLTALVAGSVLAGVTVLVLYVSSSSFTITSRLQEASLAQLAASSSRTLDLYLADAADVARALAGQEAVVAGLTGDVDRARARFRNSIESYRQYWAIFAFDTTGRVVAGYNANMEDMAGGSRADRSYVKDVLAGQDLVFTDQILSARSGDTLIFVVAKAVRGPDGRLLGGVAVCPKWNVFTKSFIDPLRFGERGYGFMLDASGTVIAHAVDKEMLLKNVADQDFVKQALARKEGLIAYDWKGERKLLAVAPVATTGWLVCMTAYESEMTAMATGQRTMLLGIGGLVLAAVVSVITLANRSLVLRPLAAVERFTEAITAGDLQASLPGVFRFELGTLAANLRRMVAELKSRLGFSQGVLAGIPAPCAVVGPDSRILWINQQVIDLLGLPATVESAKGQNTGQLFYGDPARETLSRKTITERRSLSLDIDFSTRDGKTLHLHVDTTPFYDMDGELLGCLVFWNDLTGLVAQKNRIEAQNAAIGQTASEATQVADRMAQGAEELSAQIDEANDGAQEQNGRVQETVTAVEEMNATILEVARNAAETARGAETARQKAREGAGMVTEVVAAVGAVRDAATRLKDNMRELGEKTHGIGAVLGVISDIADQTNLLALNAAIEAARAGEAGRGFAVVADEVRKLAEKTLTATKDVGEAIAAVRQGTTDTERMVDQAAAAVDQATRLAERSGTALSEIVSVVEIAGDQVRAIATAAEQQSATSEEINRAVEAISRIASETADAMAQSAQAVTELSGLAQHLNGLIDGLRNTDTP